MGVAALASDASRRQMDARNAATDISVGIRGLRIIYTQFARLAFRRQSSGPLRSCPSAAPASANDPWPGRPRLRLVTSREHPSKVVRLTNGELVGYPPACEEDCTLWIALDDAPDEWEGVLGKRLSSDTAE